MEEELSENDLEERLYAMIHHVDSTQVNLNRNVDQNDTSHFVDSASHSTFRRYWRTDFDQNTPYQKVNTSKETITTANKNKTVVNDDNKTVPKEEKRDAPAIPPAVDMLIFQNTKPQDFGKAIEIIDNDENHTVELESSDDDEVVEVTVPQRPTITIESSDEDELNTASQQSSLSKDTPKPNITKENRPTNTDRDISASPVPSVVSSVSDEFIRGDCIALNISSRHLDNHTFDFSLHGSDLLDQSQPPKKKKKRKTKEHATSTPTAAATTPKSKIATDECFATPKSKAKNRKEKSKSIITPEKSLPNVDIYNSDSNQSISDKNIDSYIVTEKSLPSADVYESDSNQSETVKSNDKPKSKSDSNQSETVKSNDKPQSKSNNVNDIDSSNSSGYLDKSFEEILNKMNSSKQTTEIIEVVDLTQDNNNITTKETNIKESIVMANVTGFNEPEDYEDDNEFDNRRKDPTHTEVPKFGSTKIPSILNEDLDFDNLKGKAKVCRKRTFSLKTLRADMEKFYNESWGGEDFNHREIQKYMSRDKSLWVIDPKDRMPTLSPRKMMCNYCNRSGHRYETCRMKPPICYMCGTAGHFEPHCPKKICVNCGSPNFFYSAMCYRCTNWVHVKCNECGQTGHPSSHCPDIWRRYHNTIDENTPLNENRQTKKHFQLYCSGCTRRGHLVHTCRVTVPFSGLPINSPYVSFYCPVYPAIKNASCNNNNAQINKNIHDKNLPQDHSISTATVFHKSDHNKRQSKSPTAHENHMNKKRNISNSEFTAEHQNINSPNTHLTQEKINDSIESNIKDNQEVNENSEKSRTIENNIDKMPDFIPIDSNNHDKKGLVIQDNEVSDTSDAITSARIYIMDDIIGNLKTKEGEEWLKDTMKKHNVIVQHTDMASFLSVKGKVGDQEAFQLELREWANDKMNEERRKSCGEGDRSQETEASLRHNIPKTRNHVLRKLNKAFESLKQDLGDPNSIYKELTYLRNHQEQLLEQKTISPKQLSNNRDNINEMLKKLNMVLLGQAGLANGFKHLNELYSLQEKVTNCRQRTISKKLRVNIGRHYHPIFTAIPRDDYMELLEKYSSYQRTFIPNYNKKKKQENALKLNSRPIQMKHFNNVTQQQKIGLDAKGNDDFSNKDSNMTMPLVNKTKNKLVFYHKRLLSARPIDAVLKKTRLELLRRLHSFIASLERNASMPSKVWKKIRTVQGQAQLFLTNV